MGTGAPAATAAYNAMRKSREIMFKEVKGKKGEIISLSGLRG